MAVPGCGFDGEGPAADHDEHDRRSRGDDGVEQLLLAAVEAEGRAVAELAGRRVVGQAGALAEDQDRDLGGARGRHCLGDLLVGPVGDAGPAGVAEVGTGERVAEGVEDRPAPGQLVGRRDRVALTDDPERIGALVHLAQGLHVDQVAVVAEQVAGAVGDRPDDRDPPAPGREREDPVVLDQDQRPLGERAGGACLVGGERVEERLVRDRDVRLVEQPEAELHAEHARRRSRRAPRR